MRTLLYPDARLNVMAALESLADTDNQERSWVNRAYPAPEKSPSFEDVVNVLFDYPDLDDNPDTCIGEMLFDSEEANFISHLMGQINKLLSKYGNTLTDEDYMSKPEWLELVGESRRCLELFLRNDHKDKRDYGDT